MPVSVQCEACGKRFQVGDRLRGKGIKCRGCGEVIRVPKADQHPQQATAGRPAAARPKLVPAASQTLPSLDHFGLPTHVDPVVLPSRSGIAWRQYTPWLLAIGAIATAGVVLAVFVGIVLKSIDNRARQPGVDESATAPDLAAAPNAPTDPARAPVRPRRKPSEAGPPANTGRGRRLADVAADRPSVWRLSADPLPEPLQLADQNSLRIRFTRQASIEYPSTPSPFMAVRDGSQDRAAYELWDLRTAARAGAVRSGRQFYRPSAVASDGSMIAGMNAFIRGTEVEVWSFKSGQRVGSVAIGQSSAEFIDFAGEGRLFTISGSTHAGHRMDAWNIQSGQQVGDRIDVGKVDVGSIAISPGRRYLALVCSGTAKRELCVFDLQAWNEAGRQPLPPKTGMDDLDCDGSAFSHDGKQITLLFTDPKHDQSRLLTFDALTGGVLTDQHVPRAMIDWMGTKGIRALQWLADGSGWLVAEEWICERQSGRAVYVPTAGRAVADPRAARVFDDSRLVYVEQGQGQSQILTSVTIDTERIKTAATADRPTGPAEGELPRLGLDRSKPAPKVAVPKDGVAWSVQPDPAPRPASAAEIRTLNLKIPIDEVGEVRITTGESARVFVAYKLPEKSTFPTFGRPAESTGTRPINRYDLATGEQLPRLDIPRESDLVDVSPDAKLMLSLETTDSHRLDLWSADDATHVAGWEPHGPGPSGKVAWARFISPQHLLTASASGSVMLWQFPERQAIYSLESGGGEFFQLTGGRRHLIAAAGKKLRLFETVSGALAGELSVDSKSPRSGIVKSVALRRDGRELVALMGDASGCVLLHWDLQTGKLLSELDLPEVPGQRLTWCNGQNVGVAQLFSGDDLFRLTFVDLARQTAFWSCHPPKRLAPLDLDERTWFIDGIGFWPSCLGGISLPPAAAVAAVSEAYAPGVEQLFGPGSRIMTDLDVSGDDAQTAGLQQKLRDGLRKRSLVQGDREALRLLIKLNRTMTGENAEYRPWVGRAETTSVPASKIHAEAKLVLGTEVLYETKTEFGMPGSLNIGGDSSPEDEVRKGQWRSAADWLSRVPVPVIVVRGSKGIVTLPGMTPFIEIDGAPGMASARGGLRSSHPTALPEIEAGLPTRRPTTTSPAHPSRAADVLAFNPALESNLAIGAATDLLFCDPRAKKLLDSLAIGGITVRIQAMAFDPQGKFIVTADHWGLVQVIDVNKSARSRLKGQMKGHRFGVGALAVSPDGTLVVSGGADKTVRVWERTTGKQLQVLTGHTAEVMAVTFHPEGKLMASGAPDGRIRIWDTQSWTEWPEQLEGPHLQVQRLTFSPDGKTLAAGLRDEEVILWDTSTWRERLSFSGHGGQAVVFSPDSRYLATASARGTAVKIWHASNGKPRMGLLGHEGTINAVAFSPDGKLVASVGSDQRLNIWEPDSKVAATAPVETKPEPPAAKAPGVQVRE